MRLGHMLDFIRIYPLGSHFYGFVKQSKGFTSWFPVKCLYFRYVWVRYWTSFAYTYIRLNPTFMAMVNRPKSHWFHVKCLYFRCVWVRYSVYFIRVSPLESHFYGYVKQSTVLLISLQLYSVRCVRVRYWPDFIRIYPLESRGHFYGYGKQSKVLPISHQMFIV